MYTSAPYMLTLYQCFTVILGTAINASHADPLPIFYCNFRVTTAHTDPLPTFIASNNTSHVDSIPLHMLTLYQHFTKVSYSTLTC